MSCNGMMSFFPTNFMLLNSHEEHQPPLSLNPILPSCSPQDFHNVNSFIGTKRPSMSFSGIDLCQETNGDQDDLSDEDGSQAGEKKRRLNIEQVRTLEKNFELGNKLEPERKIQLARALGLQPRQIAIWFQNRRARWKTKQLEKEYEILKQHFDSVKADNDVLHAQNLKLHAEIMALKNRESTESINLNKETDGSCSNRSESSSDDHNIQLDISRAPPIDQNLDISTNPITTSNQTSLLPSSPSSLSVIGTTVPTNSTALSLTHQLFQNSSIQSHKHHLDHHLDHHHNHQNVKEESFTNMFTGIEDQPGFWPWIEQHQFN